MPFRRFIAMLGPMTLLLVACGSAGQPTVGASASARMSSASEPEPSAGASASAVPAATASLPDLTETDDALLGTITSGERPCALEMSDDGRVFATNSASGSIVEIDQATEAVTVIARDLRQPCGIAWAGGSLWVATLTDRTLLRIDPASGETLDSYQLEGTPWDVQPGGGRVWVADRGVPGITSVDVESGELQPEIVTDGTPSGIAWVDGHLWAAIEGRGMLQRVDESGAEVDLTVEVGGSPAWFAATDEALWVTEPIEGGLTAVDPASGEVLRRVIVGSDPLDAVGDPSGDVWAPVGHSGELLRIGADGTVLGRVHLAGGIYVAEVIGDEIWVENFAGTQIYRVDPSAVGE